MAALGNTQFDRFAFPLSNPPFCNSNVLWPSEPSYSIPSLNTSSSQKIRRPAAAPSCSSQIEADENTAARAEDYEGAFANNNNKSDNDFPSLEKLSRVTLCPKVLTVASKTGPTLQRLEQPALQRAGLQVDRVQLGPGGYQGGNRDQPVILDNDNNLDEADAEDEAEGDVDTRRIERNASLHNIFAISELASAPTESIDVSGPWYDVEEGHYIDEPAPELGPRKQRSIPSAPAQAQPQTLLQSSKPLQDQTSRQSVGSIAQSASVESTLHSLPKPFDSGDDGWTDKETAELEKELGLAWEKQQVEPLSACTPPSPSPRSVEEPQNEIQSRERSGTTGGILEELQGASRHSSPAQDLEWWEQQDTQVGVEGGAVAVQQQEELGQPAVGDQQDLVEVNVADDPEDKEATEDPPATQPEHHFRLRGIRARQLPGHQTKTTQYQVVWGQRPNRSDSWLNEDDVRMSIPWPPCELYSQNLARWTDIFRVCEMRFSRYKGRKVFEYLVDAFGLDDSTWITEDQLRISLSPILVLELKGSSPHPLSEAQRDVLLRHSATPIRDEYGHASRASRSSSASADPALEGKPATRKRGHQDAHTEISSDTHHSTNTDDNYDAYDTSDEAPRPAKRRKPRPAPAATPTTSRRHTPELHVGQRGPLVTLSTATPEINDAQPQIDHECLSTFVDNSRHHISRASRSPSAASEAAPVAEYQEWPFQGFLKCTRIGNDVTYNLEFKLPLTLEHLHLPIDSNALDINHDATKHSQIHQAPLKPKKSKVSWVEDDIKLAQMWNEGRSWEYIFAALPNRSKGSIRVRCSTKFEKRPRTGAGRS